jgi:hypothetical protein
MRSTFHKRLKRLRNELTHEYNLLTPPPQMPFGKAFVIGLAKTGTSSMKNFLLAHGSRHLTISRKVHKRWRDGDRAYLNHCVAHFSSFDDRPWNRLDVIEQVMQSNRNVRFILTTRDPDIWFDSIRRYSIMLGREAAPESARQRSIDEIFFPHHERCRAMAKEHGHKLLEINITTDPKATEKVREFLDLPNRGIVIPHSNKTILPAGVTIPQ